MKKPYLFASILLAIVLTINIYLRLFPAYFPQLMNYARNIVEQRIRQQAVQEIETKFSNFSPLAKDKLLKNLIKNIYRENKKILDAQTNSEYLRLKDRYQDPKGQTYLMELDCWHWARYTENVVRSGHPGDKLVDGKNVDSLMFAPIGAPFLWDNFLYYFSATLYRVFSFFNPTPLFTFFFYLPLLFIFIFIVVLYFFAFRHGGNLAAFIACLFVGLCPLFLPRSCVGWYDKDILNLLLPLLVTWTYLLVPEGKLFKQKVLWIIFSSFWLSLFCFTWPAWWFIMFIVIIYEVAYSVFVYFNFNEAEDRLSLLRQHIIYLVLFLFFAIFWILIFCTPQPFTELITKALGSLTLNKPVTISIWPNVYSTVGELRISNYTEIARSVGGGYVFILSLLSILVVFLFNRKDRGFKLRSFFILFIWFLSMLFACFKGIRFVVFLAVPLGIFLGWAVSDLYGYFKSKFRFLTLIAGGIFIISLSVSIISNGFKAAKNMYPLMDDVWYRLLTVVRENTPAQSILNSWWDFGDWFKVVGRRGVIFDGQSQNVPQAYWMARCLLSRSEEEAFWILRMLNNGGNEAYNLINTYLKDPYGSVFLLEKIILSDSNTAREKLLQQLPPMVVEKIMALLFNKPKQAYFIVDPTMPSKIQAISFLGSWDFIKVYIMDQMNRKDKEQIINYLKGLGEDKDKLQRLYQEARLISKKDLDEWVSSRYQFYSGLLKGQEKDNVVYFENGFIYNPAQKNIYLYNPQDGQYRIPQSLFLMENEVITEIKFPNPSLNFSILVFKNESGYNAVSLSRELGNSLFVRLYYLNGAGLKHFKLFGEGRYDRDSIRIFKILWD